MKFAHAWWLFGTGLALLVLVGVIVGAFLLLKGQKRFGDPELIDRLITARVGPRRALKAGLFVLAIVFAFLSLAGPQYGRGTRLIPATNLDVVLVLDYSKSMYAEDVAPSRSARAKIEVARLIQSLPGARFAAIAFAGDAMSFPLTSDGGAIAQFLRQIEPNDMPVGGTAIARALSAARNLLDRDPKSREHKRVIVLVTDGEDLEGDPVEVAESAASDNIVVHVVQIGGRTAEPIPLINEQGVKKGMRRGNDGKPLTTSLSAAGEAQLSAIAEKTGGSIVRSEAGNTGLQVITDRLRSMMTQELSERVETVYADIFFYPLGLTLLFLLLEAFIPEATRRRGYLPLQTQPSPLRGSMPPAGSSNFPSRPPNRGPRGPSPSPKGTPDKKSVSVYALVLFALLLSGCETLEATLFTRESPVVNQAARAIEGQDAGVAVALLGNYLKTGCESGVLNRSDDLKSRLEAGFDLGLALFQLAERYGGKFDGAAPPEDQGEDPNAVRRSQEIDCALVALEAISSQEGASVELKAKAKYLAGNLQFLRPDFRAAVSEYDQALALIPAQPDPQTLEYARFAAHNRAIALRLIEEEPDPPKGDAGSPDEDQEQNGDAGSPGGDDEEGDGDEEQEQEDEGSDGEDEEEPPENEESEDEQSGDGDEQEQQEEQESEAGNGEEQEPEQSQPAQSSEEQEGAPPEQNDQDAKLLDLLEQAPTFQQREAQKGRRRVIRGMEDK